MTAADIARFDYDAAARALETATPDHADDALATFAYARRRVIDVDPGWTLDDDILAECVILSQRLGAL